MKIIILTGKFGMGHYSAASALAEQIKAQTPSAEILVTDLYELAFSKYCNLLYGAYACLVKNGYGLYNLAYKNTINTKQDGQQNVNLLYKYFLKCMKKYFEEERPDVVIATYSLCAYLLSEHKKATGNKIPLITCITDITTHRVWTNEGTDLYLVAENCTKNSLIAQGVAPEIIIPSGIPVKSQFYTNAAQWQNNTAHCSLFEAVECDSPPAKHRKELLIMGGGLGLLPQSLTFYKELDAIQDVHITVVTGKNKKLYRKLSKKYENITVLGYTNRADQLMRNADLIITKPGGISIFEAIYSQTPMLIFKPFLEQEIKNGKFVEDNHLGIVLEKKPENSIEEIRRILFDDILLNGIKENMYRTSQRLNNHAFHLFLRTFRKEDGSDENSPSQRGAVA